jgi:hypothetical protein
MILIVFHVDSNLCPDKETVGNLCSPSDIHGAWMPDGVITTCQIHVWLNLMPY